MAVVVLVRENKPRAGGRLYTPEQQAADMLRGQREPSYEERFQHAWHEVGGYRLAPRWRRAVSAFERVLPADEMEELVRVQAVADIPPHLRFEVFLGGAMLAAVELAHQAGEVEAI